MMFKKVCCAPFLFMFSASSIAVNDMSMMGDIPREEVHQGVKFQWMVTEKSLEALKDYDVRDDDVWVTTYPKAGTHWMIEIVNLIFADGFEEQIDRSKPLYPLEFDYSQPVAKLYDNLDRYEKIPTYEQAKTWPSPRAFITHLPEHMMPKQMYEGKGKVIFVIRNPKDTAVSLWHFLRLDKYNPKYEHWDSFLEQFCSDEALFSSWLEFNLTFWKKHRYDKNVLFLKYEDMKKDLRESVLKIADFLGRSLSAETLDRVVEKSTLDSLKQRFNSADAKSQTGKLGPPALIRKGVVGEWKTLFTVAQNEAFDELYTEKMKDSHLCMEFELV